jgi:hypothetical protein
MPAEAEEKESKYKVRSIIGTKMMKKKRYFLVWWKG